MKNQNLSRRGELVGLGVVLALGAVALWVGWRAFWFLTDDAYILFRYVSNRQLGFGYVWNPPPFLPVEGYTSFLWVALLDGVWSLAGIEPPESANRLSLAFSYATLLLVAAALWRLPLRRRLRRWRVGLIALVFAWLLANPTFLAWTSSGLETALVDLLLVAWVVVLAGPLSGRGSLALGGWVTAALALARPDGLLFAAAFVAIVWMRVRGGSGPGSSVRRALPALSPLALVVAHLAWRRAFYGEWLPNTYYAKVTGAWPESGLRYAASFVLEFGLWLPAAIVLWAWLGSRRARESGILRRPLRALGEPGTDRRVRALVLAVVAAHLAFYTLIGGDIFEYRVYCYVLPLIFLAVALALDFALESPRRILGALGLVVAVSLPVPWTLEAASAERTELRTSEAVPIASRWPAPLAWYARAFDGLQSWLIEHQVCIRHHEHALFVPYLARNNPTREEGSEIPADGYPIAASHAVGYAAWAAPHVAILDLLGLNDYVIARTPIPPTRRRRMAHSRRPPPGYVESYRPNVYLEEGRLRVRPRTPEMTAEEIRELELEWRRRVDGMSGR